MRYFGRRIYLGVVVALCIELAHGLTPGRQQRLVESISVDPRTLRAAGSDGGVCTCQVIRTWREFPGQSASPLDPARLPDLLLEFVQGDDPVQRRVRFLALLMLLSTGSARSIRS